MPWPPESTIASPRGVVWPARAVAVGCLILAICTLRPTRADSDSAAPGAVAITGIRVGFAGKYKVGCWTPVWITLESRDAEAHGVLEATLLDGDDTLCTYQSAHSIALKPGERVEVPLHVRYGRLESEIRVEFVAADQTLAERRFRGGNQAGADFGAALPTHEKLWLSIGPSVQLEAAARLWNRARPDLRAEVATIGDASALPERWLDYEGVSLAVLASSAGTQSLDQWVRFGGQLLVGAGAETENLLNAPLSAFATWKVESPVELRVASALEEYAGTTQRLPELPDGAGLQVLKIAPRDGAVEARLGEVPLVIRSPHGFGEVVYVPFDLDQPPFRDWAGQGEFLCKLLRIPIQQKETVRLTAGQQANWLGFTDLAAQLRGALDQFPGIALTPYWLVAVLIAGYIALIGPLDFLLVQRVLRRPEATWITFPLVVVGVCCGAYAFARSQKGDRLRVNQVDLVDVDLATGMMRGAAWCNIFSPRAVTYDVDIQLPGAAGEKPRKSIDEATVALDHARDCAIATFDLPGKAMGGIDATLAGPARWKQPYYVAPALDRLERLPMQVWSSKSLTARWTSLGGPPLDAKLETDLDQAPRGGFTNTTGMTLHDPLLAYGRWVIVLDDRIEPGQTIDLGEGLGERDRMELATKITHRRMVYDEQRKTFVPSADAYDQRSFDLAGVLQQMLFYDAVDGLQYTRLLNQYQAFVDGSGMLAAGRALLVARADEGGATLRLNGKPIEDPEGQRLRVYRFVIPVKPYTPKSSSRL